MPTKKPARAPASTCPAAEITSLRPDFQASRWRLLKRRPGEQELVGLLRRQIVEIEALDVADSETGGRVHVTVRERFRYALRSRAAPVPTCPIRSWRFFSPRDIPHFGRHIGFTGTELRLLLLDLVLSLHHLPGRAAETVGLSNTIPAGAEQNHIALGGVRDAVMLRRVLVLGQ